MTSAQLESLMFSTMLLGVFLLIGMFVRAKVSIFRKLLIPASIIGGAVGLILGPSVLGKTGINLIPQDWVNIWALEPGILILPLFSSLPLCNFKDDHDQKISAMPKRKLYSVLMTGFVKGPTFALQMFFGVGVALLIQGFFPNLFFYPGFGCEMPHGFNGSHSLAGVLGGVLRDGGRDYWEIAQGVGLCYATIGLLGGIMLGIFFINRAIKNGKTQIVTEKTAFSDNVTYGYIRRVSEQGNLGRETTESSNANTVSIHLALVLIVSFMGYSLRAYFKYMKFGFLSDLPAYIWSIIIGYVVNYVMNKLRLGWLFDKKAKSIITGVCTDYIILSAMASINIDLIASYMVPILIISAVGFVVTYFMTFVAFSFFMPGNYAFERAIAGWGTNTGFAATELALLNIVDPNFKSPVLEELNLGGIIFNLKDIIFVPLYLKYIVSGEPYAILMVAAVEIVIMYSVCFVIRALDLKEQKKEGLAVK